MAEAFTDESQIDIVETTETLRAVVAKPLATLVTRPAVEQSLRTVEIGPGEVMAIPQPTTRELPPMPDGMTKVQKLPDRTRVTSLSNVLGISIHEGDWQERALCSQTDPEAFFPEKGSSTREAKRTCTRCEVRDECLEYAVSRNEKFGIWGGLTERQRRKLKRRAA